MDKRPIVYGYEQGRTFDLLSGIVYAMQGDSRIALDLMGGAGTTVVSGGAATATSPATLSINVAPISIYQLGPTDATTYGALSADSLQILQVGHNDTASTVTFSTSTLTSGKSMWALVEASFVTADSIAPGDPNNGLLLYFNPTNPSSPYQGQNNNGQPQNTLRSNTVQLNVVYGAVATSGSQVPPNPSAGAVPLYLVDLTYGQTQVTTILTAGPSVGTNVPSNYPYAPFLAGLLNSHHSGTTGQAPQINLATETQGNFNRVVQASTPAQFDNSNNIVTTSFLKRAGIQLSGQITLANSTSLTIGQAGNQVTVSGNTGPITLTLPLSNAAPAYSAVFVICNYSVYNVTVAPASGNTIGVPHNVLYSGQAMAVVNDGGTNWNKLWNDADNAEAGGSNATGTWPINITGNAAAATEASSVIGGGPSSSAGHTLTLGWNGSQATLEVDITDYGVNWPISITGNANYANSAGSAPTPVGAGNVGTYGFMVLNQSVTTSTYAPGNTLAGNGLYFANVTGGYTSSPTPAGTWECMSYVGQTGGNAIGVWQRIA